MSDIISDIWWLSNWLMEMSHRRVKREELSEKCDIRVTDWCVVATVAAVECPRICAIFLFVMPRCTQQTNLHPPSSSASPPTAYNQLPPVNSRTNLEVDIDWRGRIVGCQLRTKCTHQIEWYVLGGKSQKIPHSNHHFTLQFHTDSEKSIEFRET